MKNKISKIIAATMIALVCLFTTSLTKLLICAEDTAETVSVTFNFYDADGQNVVYTKSYSVAKGGTLSEEQIAELTPQSNIVVDGEIQELPYYYYEYLNNISSTTFSSSRTKTFAYVRQITFSIPSEIMIDTKTGKGTFNIVTNVNKHTNAYIDILSENALSNGENSEEYQLYYQKMGVSYLTDGQKQIPYTISNTTTSEMITNDEAKTFTDYFVIKLDNSCLDTKYAASYSDKLTFSLYSETNNSYNGDILTVYIGDEADDALLKWVQDTQGYGFEYLPLEVKYSLIYNVCSGTKLLDAETAGKFYDFNENILALQEELGINFLGWYTKPHGKGIKITEDYVYDGTHNVFYGYWGNKIFFDPNDGSSEISQEIDVEKNEAINLSDVTTPTRENYKFLGWYTEKEDGIQIKNGDIYDGSYSTLYAHWKKAFATVTFDWNDTLGTQTSRVYKTDEECQELETPTRGTSEFLGWYTSKVNGEQVTEKTIFDNDIILYARWNLNKTTLINGNYFNQLIQGNKKITTFKGDEIITFNYDKLPSEITNVKKLIDPNPENDCDESEDIYSCKYQRTLTWLTNTTFYDDYLPYNNDLFDEEGNFEFNIKTDALDVSEAQDGSIVLWAEEIEESDANNYLSPNIQIYISTQDINNSISANPDCSFMFFDGYFKDIYEINFINFDTSNVTNMKGMFAFNDGNRGSNKLKTIDLSCFDTSNVTDMSYLFWCRGWNMFSQCFGPNLVDISSFDTSKVEDMSYMFFSTSTFFFNFERRNGNTYLTEYDDSKLIMPKTFDTSNVKNMSYMFANIYESGINDTNSENFSKKMMLSDYDTSKVTNISNMFYSSDAIKYLDLSNFEIDDAVNTDNVFYDCSELKSISFGEKWTKTVELPSFDGYQWKADSDGSLYEYNNIPFGKSDTYVLNATKCLSNSKLKTYLKSHENAIRKIIFTDTEVPDNTATTNLSINEDEPILCWLSNNILYISSLNSGEKILIDSLDGTFANLSKVNSLDLKKLDAFLVRSAVSTFANTTSLNEIKLWAYNWPTSINLPESTFCDPSGTWFKIYDGNNTYVSKYRTILDANGGTFDDGSTINYVFNGELSTYKTVNVDEGKIFKGWAFSPTATVAQYKADGSDLPTNYVGKLYAVIEETSAVVTFNVEDGTFDDGSTTNVVKYGSNYEDEVVTKYSHTDNVSDDGTQNLDYNNNEAKTEVVTIEGATSLTVTVTYGGEGYLHDWVSIFSGSHPTYTAANDYLKADIAQKLGGGSHTSQTVTYTVTGDSVTFAWKSDKTSWGDGYGYYAVVTGNGTTTPFALGSYKQPTPTASNQIFRGWTTTKGSTTVEYNADGSNIPTDETLTLYAIFTRAYLNEEWDCRLVDNYIWLHAYKGSETTYVIPSSATIDGKTYTTKIGRYSSGNLDTGTITNLSFEKGVVLDSSLYGLFGNCTKLTSLDLSNLDTSAVTDMGGMFYGCQALTSLDLSNFDTSNVTNMGGMFSDCKALTSLDVSNFNTSKVKTMESMFENCSSLTTLDVSNFDTSNVTDMSYMFFCCPKLTTIYASELFATNKVTSSIRMFMYCSNLVGGNGTVYNSSYIDKTYARIDASSTPGYFTLKSSDEETNDIETVNETNSVANIEDSFEITDEVANNESAIIENGDSSDEIATDSAETATTFKEGTEKEDFANNSQDIVPEESAEQSEVQVEEQETVD